MSNIYDIVIIGGGIVGIGVFNRLTLSGYTNVVLVEKSSQILTGASCGNSGILHTGFDTRPGTLESKLVTRGYELYHQLTNDIPLPIQKIGAHLVAWTNDDLPHLQEIVRIAHENGVFDVKEISIEQLYQSEPHLRPNAISAVFIPGECIVDPLSLPYILFTHSKLLGGHVRMNMEVKNGHFDHNDCCWNFNDGQLKGRVVINCGGLFGDYVEQIHLRESDSSQSTFHIQPRLGQFSVYASMKETSLMKSILLPIPTKFTKGIIIYPNLYNQMIVGPTAETQEDRIRAPIRSNIKDLLHQKINESFPIFSSSNYQYIGSYTGIRPATEYADYQINFDERLQWICCGGIRSTGLSSALAIGEYICDQLNSMPNIKKQLECKEYSEEQYKQSIEQLKSNFILTNKGYQLRLVPNSNESSLELECTGDLLLSTDVTKKDIRMTCDDDLLEISHSLLKLAWMTETINRD